MKLPSLTSLAESASNTFRRFGLAIIFAMIGTFYAIKLNHLPYDAKEANSRCWNIIEYAYLGMLLLVAIVIFQERRSRSIRFTALCQALGMAVIVVMYLLAPTHWDFMRIVRFILFALGLHLLIAFIGFWGNGKSNGFWQFNKALFLRILTSLLYSNVLYGGLSLALLALDKLINVHINNDWYIDLWCILMGLFNTWFFLAGCPRDFAGLEEKTEYPKGLKIFTQYVLLPIITIYIVILYLYMGKILVTAHWPVGWVSYLVLFLAVAGILSLLLIHPIRNEESNKWMLVFSKCFYYANFPLIVLLFLAIFRRIREYGITELRYFVVALAIWLFCISVYFLASKVKNIKVIPVSLCLMAFLSAFGPWSAFHVSLVSQRARLNTLLAANHRLADGKIVLNGPAVPFAERKKITSVVDYLVKYHSYHSLQPYFSLSLDSVMKKGVTSSFDFEGSQVGKILALSHIDRVEGYEVDTDQVKRFYVALGSEQTAVTLSGYDYIIEDYSETRSNMDTVRVDSLAGGKNGPGLFLIRLDTGTHVLTIATLKGQPLQVDLKPVMRAHQDNQQFGGDGLSQASLTLYASNKDLKAKVLIHRLNGSIESNRITLDDFDATILIGR